MNISDIVVGETYTYYPIIKKTGDNIHFPAIVESVGKRVRVRVFMAGLPEGVLRSVSHKRLANQCSINFDGS